MPIVSTQLRTLSVYLNNGHSIKSFRSAALEWMKRFPKSAVLVILEGHSTVETGEIVYALPGSKGNHYTNVEQVSSRQRTLYKDKDKDTKAGFPRFYVVLCMMRMIQCL